MATVYDVDTQTLIKATVEKLKESKDIKPLEWSLFVKTGSSKERPPVEKDWWYIRAASILRKVYLRGPIGVSKLRKMYGSKKNRGFKPEKFYPASGSPIRKILQQLEKEGYIEKKRKGIHSGRVITNKGKSFLDRIATEIYKNNSSSKNIKQNTNKNNSKNINQNINKNVELSEKKSEKTETRSLNKKTKEKPQKSDEKETKPKKSETKNKQQQQKNK